MPDQSLMAFLPLFAYFFLKCYRSASNVIPVVCPCAVLLRHATLHVSPVQGTHVLEKHPLSQRRPVNEKYCLLARPSRHRWSRLSFCCGFILVSCVLETYNRHHRSLLDAIQCHVQSDGGKHTARVMAWICVPNYVPTKLALCMYICIYISGHFGYKHDTIRL